MSMDAPRLVELFGLAVLSAFFNGSYAVWMKAARRDDGTEQTVNPVIFNGIVAWGIFLSSITVPWLHGRDFAWTNAGCFAGVVFVFAALLSFTAIQHAGFATAQTIWSCTAIVVAFMWSVIGPDEVKDVPISYWKSILSVLLLITGATVAVLNSQIARAFCPNCTGAAPRIAVHDKKVSTWEHVGDTDEIGVFRDATNTAEVLRTAPKGCLLRGTPNKSKNWLELASEPGFVLCKYGKRDIMRLIPGTEEIVRAPQKIFGMLLAIASGLFQGSILIPFKYSRFRDAGLLSVPAFGCGAAITGSLVTFIHWKFVILDVSGRRGNKVFMPRCSRGVFVAGLMSGVTWNLGNLCQILVQDPPFHLSYGIAYPIYQCALLFAGVWGILIFREIRGIAIVVWLVGAMILTCGVFGLAAWGPGAAAHRPDIDGAGSGPEDAVSLMF